MVYSQNPFEGANQLTVYYAGSATDAPSATVVAISNPLSDFTMTPQSSIVPVAAGGNTADIIYLASVNGFSGAVSLACTAATGVTCSIPSSVNLASGGSTTATLTLSAPASTSSGTYNVLLTGSNSTGAYVHTLGIQAVAKAPLSITTATTLPSGVAGTAYSQPLTASGGSGSGYSWTVTSGRSNLTAVSLSLSSSGVLSGSSPVAGTAAFNAKVTDSAGNTASQSFSVTINPPAKTTPTITWGTPAAITYGTALSAAQLDATASVAGTFSYSPSLGTVLNAGTQVLTVAFTPGHLRLQQRLDLGDPDGEQGHAGHQLEHTCGGDGREGTQRHTAGRHRQRSRYLRLRARSRDGDVDSRQRDPVHHLHSQQRELHQRHRHGGLSVNSASKTTPTITWGTPAAITYGTALSAAQLGATASVAGTFSYSPSLGTVLNAGTQVLTVSFTPTDTTDYNNASASVTMTVNKATPVITWNTPAAVTVGTALGAAQLDATASVAGTFVYSPPAGTVMSTTGSVTLSTTFTPKQRELHQRPPPTVVLSVTSPTKTTPIITWATPAAITYGTALSAAQLDATASVAGTFSYSPSLGTVLNAGTQVLTVSFTPTVRSPITTTPPPR